MGFLNAMKGANNYWAMVSCADGIGYLGPENFVDNRAHRLAITGSSMEKVVFGVKDVKNIDMICATSEWIKYLIVLKNNKRYIATFMVLSLSDKKGKNSGFLPTGTVDAGKKVSMGLLNFEWWMADIIYREKPVQISAPTVSPITSTPNSLSVESKQVKTTAQTKTQNTTPLKKVTVETQEEKQEKTSSNEENTYLFALQMMNTRSYNIAYNALLKIKGYKDSEELLKQIEDKI